MKKKCDYDFKVRVLNCICIFLTEQNQNLSLIQRLALISTRVSGEDLTDVCPMTGVKQLQIIEEAPPVINKWKPIPQSQPGMFNTFKAHFPFNTNIFIALFLIIAKTRGGKCRLHGASS